ncbi:hypothetical protein L210DRAFT_3506222 [Boletus edulis BED1]|uniref:Uncharacterized protein n=1 Tax=Boletus edulis BED1 TaxID=1328754 RepID=A0AAD4BNT5_BOLED|nr:hypothetical protein L210DRAFT_3506222 [Boletus edulis BED1]
MSGSNSHVHDDAQCEVRGLSGSANDCEDNKESRKGASADGKLPEPVDATNEPEGSAGVGESCKGCQWVGRDGERGDERHQHTDKTCQRQERSTNVPYDSPEPPWPPDIPTNHASKPTTRQEASIEGENGHVGGGRKRSELRDGSHGGRSGGVRQGMTKMRAQIKLLEPGRKGIMQGSSHSNPERPESEENERYVGVLEARTDVECDLECRIDVDDIEMDGKGHGQDAAKSAARCKSKRLETDALAGYKANDPGAFPDRARVVTLVPKSSASPLHFYPWDSVDPDMGPLCISREIGREMWEGPREGKLPDMSESIVGAEGKAMTWTDRQCGKALHRKPCTCTEEGPGMAEAKTANMIEWAQGQMIYEMTERVERAEVWPRHGQPRPKIKWGPYFRELLYGSINHDEALTRPRLIYTEDLEGAFYGRRGKYGRSNPTGPGQDDLQDDRGGLGPAVSWGRGAEIQGGGLLGKDYWMARYTCIMDYRPDVIIDCD